MPEERLTWLIDALTFLRVHVLPIPRPSGCDMVEVQGWLRERHTELTLKVVMVGLSVADDTAYRQELHAVCNEHGYDLWERPTACWDNARGGYIVYEYLLVSIPGWKEPQHASEH